MHYTEYISINPEVRFGRPCLTGTRINVYDVLAWLARGMSINDIIEDFPQVSNEQILACLEYAADREEHFAL
jgi:uncharacterized protein (DUF433 family)